MKIIYKLLIAYKSADRLKMSLEHLHEKYCASGQMPIKWFSSGDEKAFEPALKKMGLSLDMSIQQLTEKLGVLQAQEGIFEKKRSLATDQIYCFRKYIETIEAEYDRELYDDTDEFGNKFEKPMPLHYLMWPLNHFAFRCTREGYNPTLDKAWQLFEFSLNVSSENDLDGIKKSLNDIAIGVANAKFLKVLKERLLAIEQEEPVDFKIKPKWTGDIEEFGFIIMALIRNNKLVIPGKKYIDQAKYLMDYFDLDCELNHLKREISPSTSKVNGDIKKIRSVKQLFEAIDK